MLRKLILAAILAVSALAPIAARAGEQMTLVQQDAAPAAAGFDRSKAVAIGAGIVIGAAAASALSFRGAVVVGAVAGGLIGAWWYGDRSDYAQLQPRR